MGPVMKTGHRNQFRPGPPDAAPAPRVDLTATKAYRLRWTPSKIQTCGRAKNDREDYRGQPQLFRVLQLFWWLLDAGCWKLVADCC